MMTARASVATLDDAACRYGRSRMLFRGPARDLGGSYAVAMGGSSTFGKYVPAPWPALVEAAIDLPVVNLGGLHAGPDFYLGDPEILRVAARARLAVVQVGGADGLSNPFYTVHPRRNDRVVAVLPALARLYPEVDFTDIHFTRHLLSVLLRTDPQRFAAVRAVLQANWLAAMRQFLAHLPLRRVLLWLADSPPPAQAAGPAGDAGPVLVDRGMLEALAPAVSARVAVVPSAAARAQGLRGMQVPPTELAQASCLPGVAAHREVAETLAPVITRLL